MGRRRQAAGPSPPPRPSGPGLPALSPGPRVRSASARSRRSSGAVGFSGRIDLTRGYAGCEIAHFLASRAVVGMVLGDALPQGERPADLSSILEQAGQGAGRPVVIGILGLGGFEQPK